MHSTFKMRHFLNMANEKAEPVFVDQSKVRRALIAGSWISRGGICKSALPPVSCYFLFKVNTSKRSVARLAQIESCMRDLSLFTKNWLIRPGPGWINDAANILKFSILAVLWCNVGLIKLWMRSINKRDLIKHFNIKIYSYFSLLVHLLFLQL